MRETLRRLSSWLVEGGGQHPGVEVRELGDMRGLVATRAIPPGSEVVRVPSRLLVTLETARAQLAHRHALPADLALSSKHFLLALWLLVERRDPASAFRPYLDALPERFPACPLDAPPDERALLDGSLTGAMLDRLRAHLEADRAILAAAAPHLATARDDLVWAATCVLSRSFGVTIDGTYTTVLAPFLDMVNHDRGPSTRLDYDPDARAFRLISQRAFQPGDEVCHDYGRRSNTYLLLHYGFCIDPNDHDEAILGLVDQARVTRNPDEPLAQMLLFRLRAHHDTEASARAALADAARASLARFSTTLAEDQALLAGRDLSPNARNFIITRLGEKRVLHAWLAFASDGPSELFRWP